MEKPKNPEAGPELIERAKSEEAAFEEVYRIYGRRILTFYYYRVGSREKAEDLTQQLFLKVITAIRDYQQGSYPFSAWLFRVARNLLIDDYRKKELAKEQVPLNGHDAPATRGGVSAAENKLLVEEALHELKDEQREVLVLRFILGYGVKDIAGMLKKSENAVKLIQHRALLKARKILEKVERQDEKD